MSVVVLTPKMTVEKPPIAALSVSFDEHFAPFLTISTKIRREFWLLTRSVSGGSGRQFAVKRMTLHGEGVLFPLCLCR